jgi:protein-tyrosine phosphatase
VTAPSPVDRPFRVLLVCTANICRSPMAEAFLRDAFAARGLSATIASAGFLEAGLPASDNTVKVMAERGFDLRAHRSRVVTPALARNADLILTMERRHARDVLLLPRTTPAVHTLKGFADAAAQVAAPVPANGNRARNLRAWVGAVTEARPEFALLGDGRADEVADPHGRSIRIHRRAADDIAAAVDAAAALIAAAAG